MSRIFANGTSVVYLLHIPIDCDIWTSVRQTLSLTAVEVNLGLNQQDIFEISFWVSFGHFYASFGKCPSGMPYILGKRSLNSYSKIYGSTWRVFISPLWRPLCHVCKHFAHELGNDCDIVFIYLKSIENVQHVTVMFMLLHWYCHKGFGCGKVIIFASIIFNIFGDVYTRDGTISPCQHDAGVQIVMGHNHNTQVLDPFRSSPHWAPNDIIVTDICQYIMCHI